MLGNPLSRTDVYKMGHMEQYAPGTTRVYSYLCARSDKNYHESIFFGLQYYLKRYLLQEITKVDVKRFLRNRKRILGFESAEVTRKISALQELGYWPLEIKAIPEGTLVPAKNALFTMRTTNDDFHWAGGFLESLLLKVWYPTTTATNVFEYRKIVDDFWDLTDDLPFPVRDFAVHDFGYRSDSSEESAAISGASHLILFKGSDTLPALDFIEDWYPPQDPESWDANRLMLSVPASEHSVMCSYGRDGELQAYKRLLELYPTGIVSIVSDTYDIYQVCTKYLSILKDDILSRDGRVVIRPDSGNPPDIICGDPEAEDDSPAYKGVLRLLDELFGHTVNSKGFKVLNAKIGLIYGDGMYLQRYKNVLERMQKMGYATSNLVIGVGGILRQGTRDTLGMALKATQVEVDGESRNIMKDPVTDHKKKSHSGLFYVYKDSEGVIRTKDKASQYQEENSLLRPVFKDGKLLNTLTFEDVRKNFWDSYLERRTKSLK